MNFKKKIALVSIGVSRKDYPKFSRFQTLAAPGIYYINAALIQNGYDVTVIDQPTEEFSDNDVLQKIKALNPEIVLFNQFFNTRKKIRNIIKNLNNKYIFGVGGHDATFNSLIDINNYKDFDFIWQGEAEEDIVSFISTIDKKEEIPKISGSINKRVSNLDTLPILKHNDYSGETGFIVTSRGCFKKGCDFCTTPAFYPTAWKGRSIDNVKSELINLKNNKKKFIFITDDNFLGFTESHLDRGAEILKLCKELNLKMMILTTSDQILNADKKGYLSAWKGVVFRACIGVENNSETALKKIGKCLKMEGYSEKSFLAIHKLVKNSISPVMGFINFNPQSTFNELEESGKFLYETEMEAAKFINLRQDLNLFDGTKLLERLLSNENVNIYIKDNKYKYSYIDNKVENFYLDLKSLKNITDDTDSFLFNIEELICIYELFDTSIGQEYLKLRTETNKDNYNYYIDTLKHYRDNIEHPDKEKFIKKALKRLEQYKLLFDKISNMIN